MAINRIDQDLPTREKIRKLNDMILELNGGQAQAKFDKNELDHLYDIVGTMRKFKRSIALGNTTATYTDWSHVQAETGYSIWKITPTNYKHSALNEVYFGSKSLENRGEATSETATAFDNVQLFNGDSGSGYTTHTTEAGTEGGTEFSVMDTINDFLYLEHASTFGGIKFEFQTRGSNYTLKLEYWNGSAWTQLKTNGNNLEEGTNNFQGDGHISWDIPTNWGITTVNSVTGYFVRISTTTNPITTAKAYLIVPKISVVGLLALSHDEFTKEEWAFCSFNNSVYVTIRNTGNTSHEGDFYITSASSATNLQNFFIYNHPYTADFEDRSYEGVTTITTESGITDDNGVIILDAATQNVDADLPTAVGRSGTRYTFKIIELGSSFTATLSAASGETIDGAPTYTFSNDFESIEILSDGKNWLIISKKT